MVTYLRHQTAYEELLDFLRDKFPRGEAYEEVKKRVLLAIAAEWSGRAPAGRFLSAPETAVRDTALERLKDEAIIYRCFERLEDHQFLVQSADRVRLPIRTEDIQYQERQFGELFIECSPDERGKPHATVEEAIAAFDIDFENS